MDTKTFLSLGSFQFLSFVRRGVFYSFMYIYLFSLMGNVTSAAALGTLNMVASTLGQNLVWGRISDRYKLRAKLVILGELLAGFAYIMVFLIHKSQIDTGSNFVAGLTIIIGLSMLEFFWSMSDVGWAALLTDITAPETRGGFVGTLNFLASLGRMIGIMAAGLLYGGGSGFRQGTIFYIVTAMLFMGAVIMWFTLRSVKSNPQVKSLGNENTSSSIKRGRKEEEGARYKDKRALAWFLTSLIIIVLGSASVNQVFLLFLQIPQGLNASDMEVSIILTAWTIGGMAASVLSGRLADKIGRAKVILFGLLLAMTTPLFYGVVPNVVLMALIHGLNGASFWTIQTAGFALAGDIIPAHRRGKLFSRYNAVMALSWGPAGFMVGGPIADIQTGVLGVSRRLAYINVFMTSSLLVLVGTIIFFTKVQCYKYQNRGFSIRP